MESVSSNVHDKGYTHDSREERPIALIKREMCYNAKITLSSLLRVITLLLRAPYPSSGAHGFLVMRVCEFLALVLTKCNTRTHHLSSQRWTDCSLACSGMLFIGRKKEMQWNCVVIAFSALTRRALRVRSLLSLCPSPLTIPHYRYYYYLEDEWDVNHTFCFVLFMIIIFSLR